MGWDICVLVIGVAWALAAICIFGGCNCGDKSKNSGSYYDDYD
jgi:hypothetical protein